MQNTPLGQSYPVPFEGPVPEARSAMRRSSYSYRFVFGFGASNRDDPPPAVLLTVSRSARNDVAPLDDWGSAR